MRVLLAAILLLGASVVTATECKFAWDANPVNEEVTHYAVYKDGVIMNSLVEATSLILPCEAGTYNVTAVNIIGESLMSAPVMIIMPSAPTNFKFSLTIINL